MPSVVIVTGLSGGGKSTALNALEDLGFFSMDNLPVILLPKVLELAGTQEPIERIAVGIDARERAFIRDAGDVIDRLKNEGLRVHVVFVDADNDVLIQRYSQTRRPHPLAGHQDIASAVQAERTILEGLRERADLLINTSSLKVPDLQRIIRDNFHEGADAKMKVRLVSFGFKHGITPEADLLFDVRFIQNPYFEENLKDLNGLDIPVSDFVLLQESAQRFRAMLRDLLEFLLPKYEEAGKSYLTVAIGCTGGQHRSVAMVNAIARDLEADGWRPTVAHRETHRWPGRDANHG